MSCLFWWGQEVSGRKIKLCGQTKNYSEQIAYELDKEVKKIIDDKYNLAKQILTENRDILEELAMSLLDHETINAEEFDELIEKVKERRNS